MRLPSLRRAHHVAVYLAAGSELDTAPLIRALHRAGKRVLVPAIAPAAPDATMRMIPLDPDAPLRRRRHGIREPARRRRVTQSRVDVLVLPLRGFDGTGTRLGSGAATTIAGSHDNDPGRSASALRTRCRK